MGQRDCDPPGRFKSSIVGTDLPLVGRGFEGLSKQISRKRRFSPPCCCSLNTPMFLTFTRLGMGSNLPQRQLAYAIYIYKQKAEKGVSEEVDINELYSF